MSKNPFTSLPVVATCLALGAGTALWMMPAGASSGSSQPTAAAAVHHSARSHHHHRHHLGLGLVAVGSTSSSLHRSSSTSSSDDGSDASSAPSSPDGLMAAPGDSQVALSWNAPESDDTAITGYQVQISADGGATWSVQADPVAGTAYTATGLTDGTSYQFKVAAENINGTGELSDPVSATPMAPPPPPVVGAPGAPSGVTLVSGDDSGGTLSWIAPTDPGGSPITGYLIQVSTDGGATWTTVADQYSGTSISVTGEDDDVIYQVAAENSSGAGAFTQSTSSGENDQGDSGSSSGDTGSGGSSSDSGSSSGSDGSGSSTGSGDSSGG